MTKDTIFYFPLQSTHYPKKVNHWGCSSHSSLLLTGASLPPLLGCLFRQIKILPPEVSTSPHLCILMCCCGH